MAKDIHLQAIHDALRGCRRFGLLKDMPHADKLTGLTLSTNGRNAEGLYEHALKAKWRGCEVEVGLFLAESSDDPYVNGIAVAAWKIESVTFYTDLVFIFQAKTGKKL